MQGYVKRMAMTAMVGLVAAATVARGAGSVNFACSGNGGVATMGGGSGAQNPQRANDGNRERSTNAAAWTGSKVGGWWEVALPVVAAGGEVRQIRVFDRSCCSSIAPYDLKVYDGANVQLGATLSQAGGGLQPWIWTYDLAPGLNGAARVRLEHTGVTAGDAYMGEVEVIGWNPAASTASSCPRCRASSAGTPVPC